MRVLPEKIKFAQFFLHIEVKILSDRNGNIKIPECCIGDINILWKIYMVI